MITLYTFGPAFGLPDPSPFVMKAEVLLKMAGLAYRTDTTGLRRAPKGKLPYIDDDGQRIADSTFIRWHIEKKYGIDFDRELSREERAAAWAFEKLAEDHLYWAIVEARWTDDENFAKGPQTFFRGIPAPLRPLVMAMIRRRVRNSLHAHGMGRHSKAQIAELAARSIDAFADFLGAKPFFFGREPTGVDATAFAFTAGALCPIFTAAARTAAERHENLRAYVGRMTARYYPERSEMAGCIAAA
ncbi:MAG TPA: glutathione S-transferase C-terminal domain-containing protein [Xanthobacteraceae bacterium]